MHMAIQEDLPYHSCFYYKTNFWSTDGWKFDDETL